MKSKVNYVIAGIAFVLFLVLVVLVRTVDVAPIGPMGTSIGLSSVNKAVFTALGENTFWYSLTQIFGILAIVTAALFALVGLVQWIRRKSLLKVDREILSLAGLYVLLAGLYVFFEKVVINCRPVLMEGETAPEASFPSSHTMLVFVIMGSTAVLAKKYLQPKWLCRLAQVVCGLIVAVTVIGRQLSGVHWFTDILGSVLISVALLCTYAGFVGTNGKQKARHAAK